MSTEGFALPVLSVLDRTSSPMTAWGSVVGPVPAVSCRADLLEELPEAVEDVNPCRGVCLGDPCDVPGVVVPVLVGCDEPWVVYDPDLYGHATAPLTSTMVTVWLPRRCRRWSPAGTARRRAGIVGPGPWVTSMASPAKAPVLRWPRSLWAATTARPLRWPAGCTRSLPR